MNNRHRHLFPGMLMLLGIVFILTAAHTGSATDPPDYLDLDRLGDRYGEVAFDHALHADYAACSECHHHTTGEAPSDPVCAACHQAGDEAESVSCATCHPVQPFAVELIEQKANSTRYHIDIVGLQGAYHLNCLSCHEAIGGPTGCTDCHQSQP
ncbi:MAG: cytochrome c3 family protein [Desulfofustis sp.]|jgi:hypothetical protein|nr:cytochrome c3 family protein [Desulfofustis sp.]